jgi:sialate O-acetylesterase
VAFAQEMHRLTGVPQGVLACAHGGTSMAQWDPTLTTPSGSTLYSATLRRVHKNGGRVAGIAWYQGCSDAWPGAAAVYTEAMVALVKAFRRDCKDGKLPFVLVQIASVHGWDPNNIASWNSIQEQQRKLPERLPRVLTVPAIDLGLDDGIHISGEDQQRLGRRLAGAMATLTGVSSDPPPIALKSIRVKVNPLRGSTDVVVEFANVIGALRADGRPNGFAIAGDAGFIDTIFRVDLDGSTAILHTGMNQNELLGKSLHYGLGLAPFCNITDAADRALPVLGPVTIGDARALTPFACQYRVSGVQPAGSAVTKLAFPDLAGLALRPKTFAQDFSDLHPDILAGGVTSGVVYYACRFTCPEPMKLNVCLGYDGPVRAWVDGVARYTDPNGINPAYADQGIIPVTAAAGTHEVVVALDINKGAAWGIHLRLERRGVAAKKIGAVAMPVWEG